MGMRQRAVGGSGESVERRVGAGLALLRSEPANMIEYESRERERIAFVGLAVAGVTSGAKLLDICFPRAQIEVVQLSCGTRREHTICDAPLRMFVSERSLFSVNVAS